MGLLGLFRTLTRAVRQRYRRGTREDTVSSMATGKHLGPAPQRPGDGWDWLQPSENFKAGSRFPGGKNEENPEKRRG